MRLILLLDLLPHPLLKLELIEGSGRASANIAP
jgi:hypothetical protein